MIYDLARIDGGISEVIVYFLIVFKVEADLSDWRGTPEVYLYIVLLVLSYCYLCLLISTISRDRKARPKAPLFVQIQSYTS